MQFIVISLKTGLFQGSESLVGVFRDQEANSSKTLTLDVSPNREFDVSNFTNMIHSYANIAEWQMDM
jgi:hypothetical protein